MVKLVVAYGPPTEPAAFDQHYEETPARWRSRSPGCATSRRARCSGTPDGSAPPYHLIAQLTFDDPGALQEAMATPEGQAAAGDIRTSRPAARR